MPSRNPEVNRRNQRRWYEDNKEEQKRRSQVQRNKLRDEITIYKESFPCVDCGEYFLGVAMDFDHIGDDKICNVASMVQRNGRLKIWDEIAKCELVCSNCHRVRTASRRTGTLL